MIFVYRLVTYFLYLLAQFLPRSIWNEKIKASLDLRDSAGENFPQTTDPVILIHAASGEIEYAKSVIREIRAQLPQCKIVLTYSSPSIKKLLKLIENDLWYHSGAPWDIPHQVQKYLQKVRPQLVLIARTDIWIEFNYQLKTKNIPNLLFAATFAANSSRLKFPSVYFTKFALNQLAEIHCVSEIDQKAINNLTSTPIMVNGDTRYDQVIYRLNQYTPLKFPIVFNNNHPVFIMGSTWPEDEAQLIPVISELSNHYNFILVPHEVTPTHIQLIKAHLNKNALSDFQIYSESQSIDKKIILIDQVGILADLYRYAQISFIGGSFKKQVHSVMESIAAGKLTLVGPHFKNNREAIEFQNHFTQCQKPIVQCCQTSEQIINTLRNYQSSDFQEIEINIKKILLSKCGSTTTVINWVKTQLS